MSAMEEVMMQDLGRARKEDVSTQDFGRHNRPLTAREARMIENSRLANQYGTPEYMEANDPKRKESLAGWHTLAANAEDDGLDNLDNGQGFRRAKLFANDTNRFTNTAPAQSSHRTEPPRPVQSTQQRQSARPVTSAPTPAIHSTPKGSRNNQPNSHRAYPNGNGKPTAHSSSLAKGDLASRITYSNGNGSRINATAASNSSNNRGLARPSNDARSIPAARLANIAHHTAPSPRAQQSRNAHGEAHVLPKGPASSRRSSSDYNNVPTGPSARASRRRPPTQPGVDLVDPAQWLAITNAKIRPQQANTASPLQTETKTHADPPALLTNTKQPSSQAADIGTKQLPKSAPTQSSDTTSSTAASPASSTIASNATTKQAGNLVATFPAKQTSGQMAETATKPLPKTGSAPTQSSGTAPSTVAVPASSVSASNAITKQNGNPAANTAAMNATNPMTSDGAPNKDIKKPMKTYDVATLKSLGRPSETFSWNTRPAQAPVEASEDLISISTDSPSGNDGAAATRRGPASNELLGLIMNNGKGGGGLAASKWAK